MCQEISDLREGQLLALCRQPGVGLLFTCYLVLPVLRYPWKARPGEQSASTAELLGARSWEAGKEGLEGFGMSARGKIPKFPRMVSARAQHLQRGEEKSGQ